jgi:hypothetical protein
MKWEDAMKDNANVASSDRAFTDGSAMRSTASTSWDPHEVWLTRVKQPRELAARRDTDSAMGQTPAPTRPSPR